MKQHRTSGRKRQRDSEQEEATPLTSIRVSDVPVYLQRGEFFQSLDAEDEEWIQVPSNTVKNNVRVDNCNDLDYLLSSMRYWGVDGIVPEVVDFVLKKENISRFSQLKLILQKFKQDFTYVEALWMGLTNSSPLLSAVSLGDRDMLEYLCEHDVQRKVREYHLMEAVVGGHLECLKYLHKRAGGPLSVYLFEVAQRSGDEECFRYIYKHLPSWSMKIIWSQLVNDTNIDCYIYAFTHCRSRMEFPITARNSAMLYKGVESIQCGVAHGLPLHAELCYVPGSLEVLQYLHSSGCPWPPHLCTRYAEQGAADFLAYAHENGCPWDARQVISTAAQNGNLDCFKYAHEQGCPWDVEVATAAARASTLRCLVYARENGCPWEASACTAAVQNLANLKYLRENGCPWDDSEIVMTAVRLGKVKVLAYAHEHGCPWDERVCAAAARFCITNSACLRYAHEHGCPWDATACTAAVQGYSLAKLRYLHENGCPWGAEAYKAASDKAPCKKYLLAHGCPTS